MIEETLLSFADNGFAYAVSIFLLWKGYTQDKEYLLILTQLKNEMQAHTEQKDALINMMISKERGN